MIDHGYYTNLVDECRNASMSEAAALIVMRCDAMRCDVMLSCPATAYLFRRETYLSASLSLADSQSRCTSHVVDRAKRP